MKTINKIVAPVLLLGSLSMSAGCGAVPKWAQSGDYRDKKEMEMFEKKQMYLYSLQRSSYENGDTWTNKEGTVFTRVNNDNWIFTGKNGIKYRVRDRQIIGFVENTNIPVDTSNREFNLKVRGGYLTKDADGSWLIITKVGDKITGLDITNENIGEFIKRYDLEVGNN
jgi:hypothetical protein